MKDDEADFFDCADQFIHLANDLTADRESSRVSAAMMYASARFSAFNARTAETQSDSEVIEYLVEEYKTMLQANLEDSGLVQRSPKDK